MNMRRHRKLLLVILLLVLGVAGWQLLLDQHREQEKNLRSEMREHLLQQFPQQAEQVRRRFGLNPWRGDGLPSPEKPQVVLIHGLDDPGKVWMNLAPELDRLGFQVWVMSYPDDQAIAASAVLLAQELGRLPGQGVSRLSIVAHSMGGLVSRELLTNPLLREQPLPRVDRLIMIGTPNQGSELARFRGLAEWRDQLAEVIEGDFHWLGWVADGAGEAGIDLLPGSDFLQRLNARPQPRETQMTVIAAQLGPTEWQRLAALVGEDAEDALTWLKQASEAVGDGLVSVESARLGGTDFHLLEGSHLSVIRNLLESSKRIPPAVPLVVKLLQQDDQAMTSIP